MTPIHDAYINALLPDKLKELVKQLSIEAAAGYPRGSYTVGAGIAAYRRLLGLPAARRGVAA